MNKTKLVIFDLDGTLIDSKSIYVKVIHGSLLKNYFVFPRDRIIRALGQKLEITLGHLRKFHAKTLAKLKREINEWVARESKKLKLCPEVKETLIYLKKNDIKLVLLTNSAKKYSLLLLKRNRIYNYFDKVFYAENFTSKPEAIRQVMRQFKARKDETYYIADKKIDIRIAKNVGCKYLITLACSWDKKKFNGKKLNFVIKDLGELKNVFG